MKHILIHDHHLSTYQERILRLIVRDYFGHPVELSQKDLALKYECSRETIQRIIIFLKHFELVHIYRLGSTRYLYILKESILDFLEAPIGWMMQNRPSFPVKSDTPRDFSRVA